MQQTIDYFKFPEFKVKEKIKAVALLSGGFDSGLATFLLKEQADIYPIFIDYKQKARDAELECMMRQVEKYDYRDPVLFETSIYKTLGRGLSSDFEDLDDKDAFTPARNLLFSVIAMIYAESINASYIIRGTIANDQGNAIIRDNNEVFWNKVADISSYSVNRDIQFIAPLKNLYKKDAVLLGVEKRFDFSITWSCFNIMIQDTPNNTKIAYPCGNCANCNERSTSFNLAEIADPFTSLEIFGAKLRKL